MDSSETGGNFGGGVDALSVIRPEGVGEGVFWVMSRDLLVYAE
jgi:hypothetical protein